MKMPDDSYKPKFLDVPERVTRKGRIKPSDVGLKEDLAEMLRSQNKRVNPDEMIQTLINEDNHLLERETAYRNLNKLELKSLAKQRQTRFTDRVTPGCIIFNLLKQDTNCINEGGDLDKLPLYPDKITVYEISKDLEKMMTEQAKKETKSRKRAGRSEATEKLFDEMVDLFPNFMSKQDDPRYSLSRTKKLDTEVLEAAGVNLASYDLGNYVFYATEREVDEGADQEIFLRFMKAKEIPDFVENENTGKFTGTAEQCLKTFKRWAKKLGIPQLDKFYAEKKDKAKEEKEAKEAGKSAGEDPVEAEKAEKTAKSAKKSGKKKK